MGYIYKTTNTLNNKIYIGRYNGNDSSYLGSGMCFKRAVKRYGRKNFDKVILENNIESHEELNEREMYWIKLFNSNDPTIGYNLTKGGDGAFGYKHTQEWKDGLSERVKGEKHPLFGKHHSQETRAKMSEVRIGKYVGVNSPNYGLQRSQETRDKISKARIGKYTGENNPFYGRCGEQNPNYGKPRPQEVRDRISESNKGKIFTQEHKDNISKAKKDTPCSQETRDKMSEAHKTRWQKIREGEKE